MVQRIAKRCAQSSVPSRPPTPLLETKNQLKTHPKMRRIFHSGEVSRGGSRKAIYGVGWGPTETSLVCRIPARRLSLNCPFGSAYVRLARSNGGSRRAATRSPSGAL
jgi:hypothetical protein